MLEVNQPCNKHIHSSTTMSSVSSAKKNLKRKRNKNENIELLSTTVVGKQVKKEIEEQKQFA